MRTVFEVDGRRAEEIRGLRARATTWRWPLLGGMTVAVAVLGFLGFSARFASTGESRSAIDCMYLSLQLFTLESGSIAPPIPWTLQIARFLAPAVPIYAAIQAGLSLFRDQLAVVRARFARNHIVIAGLSRKGLNLVRAFTGRGTRVVVIEQSEQHPMAAACRETGAILLAGDASDPRILARARVHRARALVCVCGDDDGLNTRIALSALHVTEGRRARPLHCFVHVLETDLCSRLRESQAVQCAHDSFQLEFFNVREIGARLMLTEHPLGFGVPDRDRSPRIVVIGLGQLGRSLVAQAARAWWLERGDDPRELRVCVIDREAGEKTERLLLRYPQLERVCDIETHVMEKRSAAFERGDYLRDARGCLDVDAVYLCFNDDALATEAALTLQRHLAGSDVPIVIRMDQSGGLDILLSGLPGEGNGRPVHSFPLIERACTPGLVLNGVQEVLARAICATEPFGCGDGLSWTATTVDVRKDARNLADVFLSVLASLRLGIVSAADWDAQHEGVDEDVVENVAEMLWRASRESAGDWAKTPENERAECLRAVAEVFATLDSAGYQVFPLATR